MKISSIWLALTISAITSQAEILWHNSEFGSPNSVGGAKWLENGSLKITGAGNTQSSTGLDLLYAYFQPPSHLAMATMWSAASVVASQPV